MKTVLQELISELKSIESYDPIVQGIIKRAEFKLEKEKEQIVKAWEDGDYAYFYSKETGRDFDNGEDYFNEKYQTK